MENNKKQVLLIPDPPLVDKTFRTILGAVSGLVIAVVLVTIVLWHFRLEARIFLRDRFSKSELLGK